MITFSLPEAAVVMMMGASGSGKSTIAAALAAQSPGAQVISYDRCREEISGDLSNQNATPEAVLLAQGRLADRCAAGQTTIVDGTHAQHRDRAELLRIATEHGVPVLALVVATPLSTCLARQRTRPKALPGERWGRRVPELAVRNQFDGVTKALPQLHTEGFAAVLTIHPTQTAVWGLEPTEATR